MTSRSFNYLLEKYCRDARVTFKSSHCIRRTFASRLYAEGMPLEEISVQLAMVKQIQRKAISTITMKSKRNVPIWTKHYSSPHT
jgi:integrase